MGSTLMDYKTHVFNAALEGNLMGLKVRKSVYKQHCVQSLASPWVQGPGAHGYAIYSSPVDVIVINRLLSQVE